MFPHDSSMDDVIVYNSVMHNIPIGIDCHIYFDDQPETYLQRYISFGAEIVHEDDVICDEFLVDDSAIFYYLSSEEVAGLLKAIADGATYFAVDADWTIELTEPYEIMYRSSDELFFISSEDSSNPDPF